MFGQDVVYTNECELVCRVELLTLIIRDRSPASASSSTMFSSLSSIKDAWYLITLGWFNCCEGKEKRQERKNRRCVGDSLNIKILGHAAKANSFNQHWQTAAPFSSSSFLVLRSQWLTQVANDSLTVRAHYIFRQRAMGLWQSGKTLQEAHAVT